MATFSERVDDINAKVTAPETVDAASTAMADALRDSAAAAIGSLSMSGGAGVVVIRPATGPTGEAIVRTAGAYNLADRGRASSVRAYARRRSALNTPWGPRANVSGSTWAGFGITDTAREPVLEAGRQAFRDAVVPGGTP